MQLSLDPTLFLCGPRGLRTIMLDTESQWSEALASNNIRAIIRWLRRLTGDGTFGALGYLKSNCRSRSWSSYCKKKPHLWLLWDLIHWCLQWHLATGQPDMDDTLLSFSCWVQRTSEFAKKELLSFCKMILHHSSLNVYISEKTLISACLHTGFSRCQGLWMFLDRSSFTRVHVLLQRLRNLLTLAQWARRQLSSTHLWHGTRFRMHDMHFGWQQVWF